MFFESYYDFDITASAESDNGVSVSVGFDMGAGSKIDYNDDDELEAQGAAVTAADVAVGLRWLDIDCRPRRHRQLV